MSSPDSYADPIFILGILQRSGTVFLRDLLKLHPDCVIPVPIWEDYLVHHADLLVKYADSVSRDWHTDWEVENQEEILCEFLGKGLLLFLNSRVVAAPPKDSSGPAVGLPDLASQVERDCVGGDHEAAQAVDSTGTKRVVMKTPSVQNLECFFKLFPRAHLLVLVRDGRSVVESSFKTFGWKYEATMRAWADAARTILNFDQAFKDSDLKYLIVRYEDLCSDLEKELRRIFDFLGLDTETYDFEMAVNSPVRGSSELGRQGDANVHWKPVKRTSDFNPLLRWSHWGRALHERFNWIGGQYLADFGYEENRYATNRLLWAVRNRVLDIRWRLRGAARTTARKILRGRRLFEKTT